MSDPITWDQAPPPRDYDGGNRRLLQQAYRQWQTGQYDVITFRCFNKAEADNVKDLAARRYPDMVLHVSWLTWRSDP